MKLNLKKTSLIIADIALAVYLVLAVTAFNQPETAATDVCDEVVIRIEESQVKGFLDADEVKLQLQRAHLYPLGDAMQSVDVRRMEELLRQNPFVKQAECYKTTTGRVHVVLQQRMPVVRVKADNGDDYYVDEHGSIMPCSRLVSSLVVATGHISQQFARQQLRQIGLYLLEHPFWRDQIEQVNVLADGSVELVPRVGDHIVYLGRDLDLDRQLTRLGKFYRYGLSQAGWNKYSYISLAYANQIICKRHPRRDTP